MSPRDVEALKTWFRLVMVGSELDELGAVKKLFIHLAPPCSTFSKARDRNCRTRVRTWAQPGGIRPHTKKVVEGNTIAKACILFARWAWEELGATVVMENPDQSYIWLYGRPYFGRRQAYKM